MRAVIVLFCCSIKFTVLHCNFRKRAYFNFMDRISTANLALMIEDYLSLSVWVGLFVMSFQLVAFLPS